MQTSKKFLYDKIGIISQFIGLYKAEIEFEYGNEVEKALLRKDKYFHLGRRIPDNKRLDEYLPLGIEVIFSCYLMSSEDEKQPIWFVTMCQKNERNPENMLQLTAGLVNTAGKVYEIQRRHGVLLTERGERISFLGSKFYVDGKRFPSSKTLLSVLDIDDMVYFDAIPCFPEENEDQTKWFVILAYKGKRPEAHKLHENKQLEAKKKAKKLDDVDTKENSYKAYIYETVTNFTNDARTMFAFGTGFIMDIPNEEFGIILGQFKLNRFQSVLFHRKNAFLFKLPLSHADLTQVFVEGDRVNFIAVGAPSDFVTDWIAVQVSVVSAGDELLKKQDDMQMSSIINQPSRHE